MAERRVIPFTPPSTEASPALGLEKLSLKRAGSALLDDLSLQFSPQGVSALLGPNGAGKSLLLRVIAGLINPDSGRVLIPNAMRGRIGLVLQSPVLLRRSTRANLLHALKLARMPRRDRQARLEELLALGNLSELAERPARRLSGGEQQRLSIMRALAANPLLLMLDEPTAHLDPQATHAIEGLLRRIAAQGTKIVLVTHDIGQVQRLADEVALLHHGHCHEQAPKAQFLNQPQSAAARAYLEGKLLL